MNISITIPFHKNFTKYVQENQNDYSTETHHRLIQSSSLTKVLRDASDIIFSNVDLSQPGTFSVRHHSVDPSELLCSQFGTRQVHLLLCFWMLVLFIQHRITVFKKIVKIPSDSHIKGGGGRSDPPTAA